MNVNRNFFSTNLICHSFRFKENISLTLTDQQKKIAAIVVFAFSFLAICLLSIKNRQLMSNLKEAEIKTAKAEAMSAKLEAMSAKAEAISAKAEAMSAKAEVEAYKASIAEAALQKLKRPIQKEDIPLQNSETEPSKDKGEESDKQSDLTPVINQKSSLIQKNAVKIISSSEFPEDELQKQIKGLKRAFPYLFYQGAGKVYAHHFLAVDTNQKIVGCIYVGSQSKKCFVGQFDVMEDCKEKKLTKEGIKTRLMLKAMEKAQEIGKILQYEGSARTKIPDDVEKMEKKLPFYRQFSKFNIIVSEQNFLFKEDGCQYKGSRIDYDLKNFNYQDALKKLIEEENRTE